MAKSQSPTKARGRPKSKSEPKAEKERSKSRGRPKSRGRSPTPKATKSKKQSAGRSTSRPRSRARSQPRKSEPKPRSRSSNRAASASKKAAAATSPDKKPEVAATRVSRRTLAAREAAKGKTVVDGPHDQRSSKLTSKPIEGLQRFVNAVKNFGYRRTFGALWWLIALPVFVIGLHLLCVKDRCYIRFDPTIPKALRVYVDPIVIGYGLAAIGLQAFLSALPIGAVVNGFGYRRAHYQYRANGFLCLLVSFGLYLSAVHYFRLPHTQILQTHRFKCVCAGTIVAFLYALFLYVKSFWASSFHLNHGSACGRGIEHNLVHDFVHGREVSPKIGRTFDLGLLVLRTTNFVWLVAIYSSFLQSKGDGPVFTTANFTVNFVVGMQSAYVIAGSLFETSILKSAFINQGVGFLTVFTSLVLTPFCASLPLRYLVDAKVAVPSTYSYPAFFTMYLIGLYLIFYSNYEKYHNARAGGKLLRTGTWSIVRHPNYLGEVLCACAWTFPCGFVALPYAHLVFITLLVICRSHLVEKNVNAEYKSYQSEVKSRVIPLVY